MIKFLLLLPVLALCLTGAAQNTIGLPEVVNFSHLEFRTRTQTWDMRQDSSGRMYYANNDGLLIYDGSYWNLYPQPNKSILRSIALADGRIYAGGQEELGFFAPDAQGVLHYSSLRHLIPGGQERFTDVWETEVHGQSVFFRTWDKIFEYRNEAIRVYPAKTGWQFMGAAGGRIFAQDKVSGLFEFKSGEWHPAATAPPETGFEVTGVSALEGDTLLISTLQHGLYVLAGGRLVRKPTEADGIFFNSRIYSFVRINNSEFAAGTTSEGCLIINDAGKLVQRIARPEGLQNNSVLSVFLDREKNLWAGLNNGISLIPYNAAIKFIKPATPNEVAGYAARVFEGRLYIATSDGTFTVPLNEPGGDLSFCKGSFEKIPQTGGQCWRLDEVNGQLLLGHSHGSFLIKNNQAVQVTPDPGVWLFLPVTTVMPAVHVLAGTYAGLSMLEFVNNKITGKWEVKGPYESRRFLAIDNNNTVWASHPYRGVYRLLMAPDYRSYTTRFYTDTNGLPSPLRNFVFRIRNRVVVATEKGVYEFDQAKDGFIPAPAFRDIFGQMPLRYLKEDTEGNIWFCSGKKIGVVLFDAGGKQHRLIYFHELAGKFLGGFENIFPHNNKNILIASGNGIIHLNLEKYLGPGTPPDILLTQAKCTGSKDSIFRGGFLTGDRLTTVFSHSNNSFHFEYSVPAFGVQSNMEYSYRLEGYDRDWSAWSFRTEKDYTNLPHGNYTFHVKARNSLGVVSTSRLLRFKITAPWYKTTLAYLAYALLIVCLMWLLHRRQQQKLIHQRRRFDEEQKRLNYIHQLEMEKNEKEIIQLQNEKLVNEVIYKNRELAGVSMHLAERSDALIKVKNELQQLYKKTGDNHDVKKALQLVNGLEKNNTYWEQFAAHFDEVNNDFLKTLKTRFPGLTSTDLKVCAYLRLKLTSKEIAQLMNISVRGVEISRYRLRRKLNLASGQSLSDFLSNV